MDKPIKTFTKINDKLDELSFIKEAKISMKLAWKKIKFHTVNIISIIFSSKSKTFSLNCAWFLFIVFGMGQLGPIIGYALSYWNNESLINSIQTGAGKAELLTCATAILAGATYFLVKEYNSSENIGNRPVKSIFILWSAILGLACVLTTAKLLADPGLNSTHQSNIHWLLYGSAMLTALALWLLEEFQITAQQDVKKLIEESENLTESSKNIQTSDGMRI